MRWQGTKSSRHGFDRHVVRVMCYFSPPALRSNRSWCVSWHMHAEQVRVGAGCDLDMDQVAEVLTAGTDSICVHSIGYTLTVYRYIGFCMCSTVAKQ